MSQIFEALRQAEFLESTRLSAKPEPTITERRRSGRRSIAAQIRIYGHGQGTGPFFEENSVINASRTGALLLMKTPVVAGQKLLLINEAAERVQECRVVRTACCDSLQFEVAVEFSSPHTEFWTRLGEPVDIRAEKRRSPRVVLPRGMDITWQGSGKRAISRVQTISAGGVSIVAREPASKGELLQLSFEVPAGPVTAEGVVRHSHPGDGMGVEFVPLSHESQTRLNHLLKKLLG
jgi:hypothetical protein